MSSLLKACGISKTYGGVQALRGVDFEVVRGEVHAVVGENGAGKSTLMRLLAGLERPDAGTLRWQDREIRFHGPHEALARGIHLIPQELMPFPDLSVAENLFVGQEPAGWLPGTIDQGQIRQRAVELLGRAGFELDPDTRMGDLTVAQMQGVEIARALASEVQLLILDEPTSALSSHEIERLFSLIEDLRRGGLALVYISHKLDEVYRLADRVTVLRDGLKVGTTPAREVKPDRLIQWMVGRELAREGRFARARPAGDGLLEVRNLDLPGCFSDISLAVHRGEIVGLAGLVGAGRTELASALYGLRPAASGEVWLRGRRVLIRHPADALRAGIAMVTEDRQGLGLVGTLSVKENLVLALRSLGRRGWRIDHRAEEQLARHWVQAVQIKMDDLSQGVLELSGGNQQKVVLARALMTEPSVLILDEPTRGIDVGAKAEIYHLLRQFRDDGLGMLLISSELPELLALCDRILVMGEGRLRAELEAPATTEAVILSYAMPRGNRGRVTGRQEVPPCRDGNPTGNG
jgi:ABC-type sugar transport system ATPase subunit